MPTTRHEPTKSEILEFIKDNVAMKEDLKPLATKRELGQMNRDLHHKLDGIGKQLLDLKTENAANISAHCRFDHRDSIFAAKLAINLDKVDAEA